MKVSVARKVTHLSPLQILGGAEGQTGAPKEAVCHSSRSSLFRLYSTFHSSPALVSKPGSPQVVSSASGASLLGASLTWRRPLVLFAPLYSTIYKAQPTAL